MNQAKYPSKERVERNGYLVYAQGDDIPLTDADELVRQGHLTEGDLADLIRLGILVKNGDPAPAEVDERSSPTGARARSPRAPK